VAAASIIESISIDTQVFVATGYGFTSKSFQSLKNHFASGRLKLVMTDITVREVHNRIKQSVDEELLLHREFVNKAKALFNSSIPAVKTSVTKFDPNAVAKDLSHNFNSFLKKAKAKIIATKGLTVGDVFDNYFEGIAPFDDNEIKRHEFPDAFCVKALSEWAQKKGLKMFVVSGDKKFYEACSKCTQLVAKKTLSEVLDHVASDDAARASFVRAETKKRMSKIAAEAKHQFQDRYYWVENMDGDAEVNIETIDPIQNDPEIIEIQKDEASLVVMFDATYSAHLSYDDPATASYDEGDLVYIQHREEDVFDREQQLTVEVKVTFDDMDPHSFKITEIDLIEPGDSYAIETEADYHDEWPYK
jgi:hypothetical protein